MKNDNPRFEKAFFELKLMGDINPSAKKTYELLRKLNAETEDVETDLLISELHQIQYGSNTNSVFYFYFPIISFILFYKPTYEKEILAYLIAPNFANGTTKTKEMIQMIQHAMKYKLTENKHYLTAESQYWISNELSSMENEIEREILKCWKELDE